jgi:arabinogalactan oligomer/maltooligosaccharide transport system permease protein
VCGPWYAASGYLAAKKAWAIAPLFEHEGRPMGSLVTVEAAFVASSARDPEAAREVARFLAGEEGQAARYRDLALPPVDARAYGPDAKLPPSKSPLAAELARVERASLEAGLVTPSSERMGAVWRPAEDVLRASLAGRSVPEAIDAATYTLSRVGGARVEGRDARPFGILLAVAIGAGVMLVARQVRRDAEGPEAARARQTGAWGSAALPYLAPGVSAAAVLVLAPVVAGVVMSLFEYDAGRFVFVGLDNFRELLFPPLARAFVARSFYFALAVTLLWTLLNVVLHVVLGVGAALLLRPAWVRFRTPLRLLLVLPWAIPNYITALMWKGMFHAQVGAINALLAPFGFSGFSWFDRFGTAFFANLVTNTWLGFPFMMVVTLGALSAIPKELEEAATLDGASRWQRLTRIVLPQIRPALLPSVILGSVWTFNMFNVVYLVSAGEPGSETDILISEAYRWAFERGQRYGFAAAYSVLIFGFLLVYSRLTSKLTAEEAR